MPEQIIVMLNNKMTFYPNITLRMLCPNIYVTLYFSLYLTLNIYTVYKKTVSNAFEANKMHDFFLGFCKQI